MLPIHRIIWNEMRVRDMPQRVPEPDESMEDIDQVRAYVKAYEWGGPTSALQLQHLFNLSQLIRPGDVVLDLACGPGPLLLELAALYPDCTFVGADLSSPMLAVLSETAQTQGLKNVKVLREDIRHLPSLTEDSVDTVISTSALHHLPDEDSLRQTFYRIEHVLKADGALYLFDFGLLRSPETRRLMVAEVAKKAPAITAADYANSLAASFQIPFVLRLARQTIRRALICESSAFVDFYYFIRTLPRTSTPANVTSYCSARARQFSVETSVERAMLRILKRRR